VLLLAVVGASGAGAARRPPGVLVKRVTVVGNSVFPDRVIERVTARYEGRRLTLKDLRGIAREVEEFYHRHGYVLARAFLPEQEIVDGHVVVHVVEGRFGRVVVEGNDYYSARFIRRLFWPARRSDVVHLPEMEHALLVLNEYPDLTVQSVFKAGQEVGTSDVIIKVRDERPLHLELAADNFGTHLIGQDRVTAGVTAGNTLIEGDRLVLRGTQVTSGGSSPFLQVDYGWPVDRFGRRVSLGYANAITKVGAELAALDIRGRADILSLTLWSPLTRSVAVNSDWSIAFVAKAVENFIMATTPTSKDELRNLVLSYDRSKLDPGGKTVVALTLTQGLGQGLGGTAAGDTTASRVGASASFTKVNADVTRIVHFSTLNQVLLHASVQADSHPLTVPEQFALGGADSVRGFEQSEFLGDHGYAVTAEYRRTFYEADNTTVQGIAFADSGYAAIDHPISNEISGKHLTGAGVGVRAQISSKTSVRLDVAAPVSPAKAADGSKSEVYAQVTTRF